MEVPASEGTTTAGQAGADQAGAGPGTADQAGAGPGTADQAGADQAGAELGTAGQAGAGQAGEPDSVAGRYDRLAPVWRASTDDNLWNEHLERRPVRELLYEPLAGTTVLDAGCAAGAHSQWLLDRGCRVTGIDISPAMIEAARLRCAGRGEFLVADFAQPLPLPDGCFDGVLSSLALHHVRDIGGPLAEFARVLRPAGWLVLSLDHPAAPYSGAARPDYFATELITQTWSKEGVAVRQSFWRRPLEAVVDELGRAGFLLERIREPRLDADARRRFGDEAKAIEGIPFFIIYRAVLPQRN